jgi:preprotein translocase subunit SecY
MTDFINKIKLALSDSTLRKRILFVAGFLIIFRLLANIPIPGIDVLKLQTLFNSNQFLGLINVFSGGGLDQLSIVMLGVGPYITATIIMQLLTMMSPKLKAMYHEEGELGRKKFSQYSRIITLPLALLQGFAFLALLQRQGVLGSLSSFDLAVNIIVVAGGSVLLMWIGELMTEYGIGNGTSMIIFAGIVARIPSALKQIFFTFDPSQIPLYLGFAVAAIAIILGVVVVSEAERPIPITYAKRVRGSKVYGGISTYLPLRVNQAGVIPIIFALSILLFPQMIFGFLANSGNSIAHSIGTIVMGLLSNGWFYSIFYFVLVFVFTYFYTAVTFDPHAISGIYRQSFDQNYARWSCLPRFDCCSAFSYAIHHW